MSLIKKPLLRSENEKMNNSQISIVHICNPKKNPYFRKECLYICRLP